MKFFEDIAVGERFELGRHTFDADGIKAFARRFDPQPFHLDEAAAARSHFGALCASGWHTAAVWMRLMVDTQRREDEARRAARRAGRDARAVAGFKELKWLKPVYVGDTISYATEVVETRPSNSRPGWGLITIRNSGMNQKGEPVISFVSVAFVERRNKGAHDARHRGGARPPAGAVASKAEERRAIGVACGAHALHDGYTDLIYVMLPIWQAEFGIGFAALGLLRTCYSGTMAGLQIPSALLSERLGVPLVLAVGTALSGIGYLVAGASIGFWTLVAALLIGGWAPARSIRSPRRWSRAPSPVRARSRRSAPTISPATSARCRCRRRPR